MARQAGPLYFTGTIGDLIFYKIGENYYMRQAGSYNTKAVQKPGARPLMQLKQAEFGRASQLAKEVYWRQLPREKRGWGVHSKMTKIARQLLQEGKSEAEVLALVVPLYLGEVVGSKQEEPTAAVAPAEQPQQEKPVAKTTRKQPACTALSGWQVSEKGVLLEDSGKEHEVSGRVSKSHTVLSTRGGCAPCVYRELRPPLKE